ncbi:MAG: hypothetical protein Q9181_006171 [Wetmoreana brouardii]
METRHFFTTVQGQTVQQSVDTNSSSEVARPHPHLAPSQPSPATRRASTSKRSKKLTVDTKATALALSQKARILWRQSSTGGNHSAGLTPLPKFKATAIVQVLTEEAAEAGQWRLGWGHVDDEEDDTTSYHTRYELWGPARDNWPDVLFRMLNALPWSADYFDTVYRPR